MRIATWMILATLAIGTAAMASEKTFEKSFEVGSGGLLTVKTDKGSVDVLGMDSQSARIVVTFKSDRWNEDELDDLIERFKLDMDRQGNDILVTLRDPKRGWGRQVKHLDVQFDIQVPRKYNANIRTSGGGISVETLEGEAQCHTSGGSLSFDQVFGPVRGETSGGNIDLVDTMRPAHLETSGGSITFENVTSVTANTSGGSIHAADFEGPITAETSGGNINIMILKQPKGDVRFRTSGGNIEAELDSELRLNLEAGTSGGRFTTDFPISIQGRISKEHIQAKINGGGPYLELYTSGGNIHVEKMNPANN